jgi:hypothetical protein
MKKHSRIIIIAISVISVVAIAIIWSNISFQKAKQDDLNSRFGTRELTSQEVNDLASQALIVQSDKSV